MVCRGAEQFKDHLSPIKVHVSVSKLLWYVVMVSTNFIALSDEAGLVGTKSTTLTSQKLRMRSLVNLFSGILECVKL